MPVAAADGETGDEVVQDEVVQDDEPRGPAQHIDDPPVCLGVVADMEDRKIRTSRHPLPPALDDVHLDPFPQRRQEQCRVVRNPGPLRRQR